MAIETLFSGNALRAVDAEGRTVLPPFVLRVLERRNACPEVVFGAHEVDPCTRGYDQGYQSVLFSELQRRRLREESEGLPAAAHHSRARRTFGAVERAAYDSGGRVTLPPMMRRRSGIRASALFIGAGGSFEVWSPDVAREAADEAVKEVAEFAVLQSAVSEESEREQ